MAKKLNGYASLKEYKKYVTQKLEQLFPVFFKAAVGDFSSHLQLPEEDDEFTELFVGVQLMLDVVNEKIREIEKAKEDIYVRKDRMWIKVPYKDILFIKADNNNIKIYTREQVFRATQSLKEVEQLLPRDLFFRVHRSYIISLKQIERLDSDIVEIGNRSIPISRPYLTLLNEKLNFVK